VGAAGVHTTEVIPDAGTHGLRIAFLAGVRAGVVPRVLGLSGTVGAVAMPAIVAVVLYFGSAGHQACAGFADRKTVVGVL
jgi:hypothetical protein